MGGFVGKKSVWGEEGGIGSGCLSVRDASARSSGTKWLDGILINPRSTELLGA